MPSVGLAVGSSIVTGVARDAGADLLPAITLPFGFPRFQRDGYSLEMQSQFSDQPMQTGSARRRRVYVSTPRTVNAFLELNLSQAAAFFAWFEGPMRAGQEFFSAEMLEPDGSLYWFKTRFIAPYEDEYLGGQWWKIKCQLIVFGSGSYSAPAISQLIGGVVFDLVAGANLVTTSPLNGGVLFDLLSVSTLSNLTGGVVFDLLDATFVVAPSVGAAAGTSTVSGVGQINVITAVSLGFATVTGVGKSLVASVGFSAGSALVLGAPAIALAVGQAAGSSSAQAGVAVTGQGVAAGVGTALGVFPYTPPTWQSGTFSTGLLSGETFTGVAYGNKFLAVSPGRFFTSTDGSTWAANSPPTANSFQRPAWNGTLWCAISAALSTVYTSTNGTTWSSAGSLGTGFTQIVWDGTNFVAFNASTGAVSASPTGTTWTAKTALPVNSGEIYLFVSDTAGGRILVFLTNLTINGVNTRTTSNSGGTWASSGIPGSLSCSKGAWNGSVFLGGASYAQLLSSSSPETSSWTDRSNFDYAGRIFQIAASGSTFYVSRTDAGTALEYTTDNGATWSTDTLPAGTNQGFIAANSAGSITVLLPQTASATTFKYRS